MSPVNMEDDLDTADLVPQTTVEDGAAPPVSSKIQVYKRRWYVLFIFVLSGTMQTFIQGSWAPIAESAKAAFGWQNSDIGLMQSWGQITILLSAIFFTWFIKVKGVRLTSILVTGFMFTATVCKCITSQPPYSSVLFHIAQILNGLGGVYFLSSPALISTLWFPVKERTTATATGALMGIFGGLAAVLIGPHIVPVPHANLTEVFQDDAATHNYSTRITIADTRGQIMLLNYIQCGLAAIVFLATIAYLPSAPPKPPSLSAAMRRVEYRASMKLLLTNRSFWLQSTAFALSHGFATFWTGVMILSLQPLGVSQAEASTIGGCTILACIASCVVMSRAADVYIQRTKYAIVASYAVGLLWTVLYLLHYIGVIPHSLPFLYVAIVCMGVFIWGPSPLLIELLCETAYPVAEGVTNGVLMWYTNIVVLLGNLTLVASGSGTEWIAWTAVGCMALAIVMLTIAKDRYARHILDVAI